MIVTLLISLLLPHTSAAAKHTCTSRELKSKDCRLSVGSYQVRLLRETIARDDGSWRAVDDMPLKGEGVQWQKVRFDMFKGWPVLQLWLWDEGHGEAKVQNQRWYVADLSTAKMSVLNESVVRRRTPKEKGFILDAMEKHDLKSTKAGELEWRLRDEKKTFKKSFETGKPTPAS